MKNYRKKPVVIQAVKYTGENDQEIMDFVGVNASGHRPTSLSIFINTLEGEMTCSVGDFVIKGVQGEFYPCKSDIFEKTYEEVI